MKSIIVDMVVIAIIFLAVCGLVWLACQVAYVTKKINGHGKKL